MLRSVIINLIDNAAEALEDATRREIMVATHLRPESDTIEIAVADTGHGISPEDKDKLFLPHFSTKDRGTGLGLGDCRPHHFRTWRLAARGRQSSRRFALSDRVACRGVVRRLRNRAHWSRQRSMTLHPKILIVDDEEGIRESLTSILRDERYSVDAVASGEEALAHIAGGDFQVVLLDVWLPGIDGMEALSRIQDLPGPPAVIMISGHGTIETAVRATKLGAFDFIEKPLSLERIIVLVRNALQQRRLAGGEPDAAQ